jgi:DNA-binding transcriptional LysR family regulator
MQAWDDLRFFLAVARHGSLSAAARALAVSQPTMGRRIAAFERRLGARLFQRGARGFALTATGQAMRSHVERMETEALGAERSAIGRDDGMRGKVQITGSEWLVVRVLAPAISRVLERNPGLTIELTADVRHLNLGRREADLAVRPSAFDQPTVYQRRIGHVAFAIYASSTYLARHGPPDFARRAADHTIIAMADDVGDVAREWMAIHARQARVVVRTNGREQMATLAAAGIGLACLPHLVGDATVGLARVTSPPLPVRPLWLGVHRDMRDVPRVRATIAALAAEVPALAPLGT